VEPGMSVEKPSVDELRARLRELGYLDAGMDRFVLGPVRASRRPASVAWRSSVRIGLLAALLLGPSAAVGLSVRIPGLVTGVRDGVVLALYLGALFGGGVAGAVFVVTFLLGTMAARPGGGAAIQARARGLARAAGVTVAGACLVYLVLWWRTVSPAGTVWHSTAWTVLVLAFTTVISMLLGHAATVTTLALAARGTAGAVPELRLRSRSWLLTLAVGLFAFAAGAGLLFVATRGEERAAGTAAPTTLARPAATGVRVLVVAIDGLDLPFLERLATAGRTPRLARLFGGARLLIPASDAPDPARTWTSLATGQPAEVHGVSGIEARRVSGIEGTMPADQSGLTAAIGTATDLVRLTRPALTTGLQRRSKSFWEVAAEHGLRVFVANWWATWPVPEGTGVVLSDRATLRLERGGSLDAEIAPGALYAPLRQAWPSLRDGARRQVIAAFPAADDRDEAVLRRAAEQDAVAVALAARVFDPAADLRAVYLPGLDIAQHDLIVGGTGLPASAMAARVDALERYYVFLDQALSPLVDDVLPETVVAVVADPGRSTSRGTGVLALSGSPVRAGVQMPGTGADVGPTLLYMLGVPMSRELAGRPALGLLDPAFTARVPVRATDSYGRRSLSPRPSSATPLDREMLDRLRSLGYVR
jgi:hypothetical protein